MKPEKISGGKGNWLPLFRRNRRGCEYELLETPKYIHLILFSFLSTFLDGQEK